MVVHYKAEISVDCEILMRLGRKESAASVTTIHTTPTLYSGNSCSHPFDLRRMSLSEDEDDLDKDTLGRKVIKCVQS